MAVRLSTLHAGRPLHPGRFLVPVSVTGWVDPSAIVLLEELDPVTLEHSASTSYATACPISVICRVIQLGSMGCHSWLSRREMPVCLETAETMHSRSRQAPAISRGIWGSHSSDHEEFYLLGCNVPAFTLVSCSPYFSTLKMEAIFSSEMSVDFRRTTRNDMPEDITSLFIFFSVHEDSVRFLRGRNICIYIYITHVTFRLQVLIHQPVL
jgi:hypothetical protein